MLAGSSPLENCNLTTVVSGTSTSWSVGELNTTSPEGLSKSSELPWPRALTWDSTPAGERVQICEVPVWSGRVTAIQPPATS